MTPFAALLAIFCLGLLPATVQAQHPYAGFEARAIKALSEHDVSDLRAGRGMGMALAAELNGYPGPMHVLELANQLELSGEQRQRVQNLYEAMKAEAIAAGEKLIDGETALDRAFNDRNINAAQLAQLSTTIGKMQGELRAVHLKYHLTTCPYRKSDPDVLVVETTENRPRKNPADGMNCT